MLVQVQFYFQVQKYSWGDEALKKKKNEEAVNQEIILG